MTDEELRAAYIRMVVIAYEDEKISKAWYENLIARPGKSLEEIEQNTLDARYAMEHGEYYKLLERIEKGENMLEAETDPRKKLQYSKLLDSLTKKLEELRPV